MTEWGCKVNEFKIIKINKRSISHNEKMWHYVKKIGILEKEPNRIPGNEKKDLLKLKN